MLISSKLIGLRQFFVFRKVSKICNFVNFQRVWVIFGSKCGELTELAEKIKITHKYTCYNWCAVESNDNPMNSMRHTDNPRDHSKSVPRMTANRSLYPPFDTDYPDPRDNFFGTLSTVGHMRHVSDRLGRALRHTFFGELSIL